MNGRAQTSFSHTISVISALVLLSSLSAILWFAASVPKLQRFDDPDGALAHMVSRIMEAQEGLRRAPTWQRWITEWAAGSQEAERAQAIRWYEELVAMTGQPVSRLRLAILRGETGQAPEALLPVTAWTTMGDPMPLYAELVEGAYGLGPLEREQGFALQASLAEALPSGWFYDAMAARIAQRAGDQAFLTAVDTHRMVQGRRLQRWAHALLVTELFCLMVGTVMLVRLARGMSPGWFRLPVPGVPPPWTGGAGVAVLLRGGALGSLLSLAFLSLTPAEHLLSLRAVAIPIANVPLLAMAYAYLLRPAGLSLWDGFGLKVARGQGMKLAGMVIVVVAVGLWGEWMMGRLSEMVGLTNHWTEWFDPDLVWAPHSVLAITLVEYVIFAPIFEELAFRGLLFATLRRRLSFAPAALLSAGLFALAHGYGWIGFISVLWSGVLWAWVYEKTGSLIPGMVAHALNNLLVCLAVMALLR